MSSSVVQNASPGTSAVPTEVLAALRSAQQVAIIGHVTPDADALASMGALWLALPELGVTPYLSLPEGSVSRQLQYLVRYAGLQVSSRAQLAACDLAVGLDTAKEKRLNFDGDLTAVLAKPFINIDHHATNPQFGKWNWVVAHASSTSELVYLLLVALGCQITPTIATLLYAGLHTDTQGFSLGNTTAQSLDVGHALAAAGAEIHEVCERMHRSHSPGEFALLAVVYRNTRVGAGGRLAWSTASHTEIASAGCSAADIDNQVEVVRSIEGIAVAILFSEGNPGKIRMNFRGERGVSVLELAQQFGGGGHHGSAGAILDGTIEDVLACVLPAAEAYVAGLALPEE